MLRSTLQKYAAMQLLAADTMQFIQSYIQVGQSPDICCAKWAGSSAIR